MHNPVQDMNISINSLPASGQQLLLFTLVQKEPCNFKNPEQWQSLVD
jgi:hypothetical protein